MFLHNARQLKAKTEGVSAAICQNLFPLCAALAISPAYAFENGYRLEVETGGVWQSRNVAQSPAQVTTTLPQGSRFSLKELQGAGPNFFARLSAGYTWNDRHQVHALYAPLTITGSGTLQSQTLFQGESFAANTPIDARYRFDSYRIGYRYKVLDANDWQIWGGITLKIRDANISLSQGAVKANRANTGP
ncbi:hypothetical protein K2X33_01650, partial [bacterium]|nr:hypothetical protein [bacterium]